MTKIIDLIPKDLINKWDGFYHKVFAPTSLDSESTVVISLFNKGGGETAIAFDLHEGVELKEGKTMKTYKIAATWEVCGEIEVEANSLKKALDKAEKDDEISLPEANYVDGSFRIDREMSKYLNEGLPDKPENME